MRLILLLALSSALSAPASAQTSPPSRVAPPGDTAGAHSPASAEAGGAFSLVERPSDMVARLARTALLAPGDSAAWRALAGALPELALGGPADLEGTLEAARIADSVAATLHAGGAEVDTPPPDTAALVPASPRSARGSLLWPALLMGAGALLLGAVGVVEARGRTPRPGRGGSRAEGAGRLWTARTLAGGGVPRAEIARRTGMAQEAVDLALSLAGAPTSAAARGQRGGPDRTPPAARRVPADGLRRSLEAGVGALADGRLTYGGGVSR